MLCTKEILDEIPSVKISVYISKDLLVKVIMGDAEVKTIICSDKSTFKFPMKVEDINTLTKVLVESKKYLLDSGSNERHRT